MSMATISVQMRVVMIAYVLHAAEGTLQIVRNTMHEAGK